MKKLGLLNCGGAHAVNCTPPTSRKNDRGAAAIGRQQNEAGSPRRLNRGGPLEGLSERQRTAFKEGLDGWAANYGYPTERRTEAVNRLVAAAEQRAAKIDVSGLGLRRLPTQISMLDKTKALDAQKNDLRRLTKEVGEMHALHSLELQDNKLPSLPPEIGQLTKLTYLNIDRNRLERLPDTIEGLINLRTLSAQRNLLSEVPASMKNLPNLKELNLKNNQIWQLPNGWSELFHGLRSLNLSYNKLTGLPVTFANPAYSMTLHLEHNRDLSTLPTKFGGFEYASVFENHTLRNKTGKIIVHTQNTKIRPTLVQSGRLNPGRGILASDRPVRASERPPAVGQYAPDLGSVYSADEYIREHGQPGQVIGLERVGQPELPGADALGPQPAWTKPVDGWLDERAQEYADRYGAPLPPPPAPAQAPYAATWGAWPHLGLSGFALPAAPPPQFNFDTPAAVPPNLDVHALANLLMQFSRPPQPNAAPNAAAVLSSLHAPGPSMAVPSMPSTSTAAQPQMPANATSTSWAHLEQPLRSPPPWAEAVRPRLDADEQTRETSGPPAWAASTSTTETAPPAAGMPPWVASTPPVQEETESDPDPTPYGNAPWAYGGIGADPETRDYSSYAWSSPPHTDSEAAPTSGIDLFEQMMSIFKID